MNKEKVVPEIRFEGFSNNWDKKELSKVTERVVRKNIDLVSMNPLTISALAGLISQLDYYNFQVASKDLSNYYLLSKGDFAYNKSYSTGYPVGAIKRLDYYEKGLLSTLYIVFRPTNVNSEFLKHYYESNYWHKGIYDIAEEGARNHGLLNVAPIQFFETHLNLPVSDLEQSRIGNLFEKIEGNIKKREQEIYKLKNFKKAMLQKMFPKEDEIVPELRFKEFEGGWDKQTLNSVTDVRDGTHDSPKYQTEGHPFITSKNVKDGYINYDDIQYISDIDFHKINNRSKVDKNDILMGMIGTIGNIALVRKEPDFAIKNVALIKDIGDINYLFLYYILQSSYITKQLEEGMDGGTQKFISLKKIRSLKISIPKVGEQTCIGDFFNKLDKTLESKQAELDKLKQFKQAMLDKMFV